MQQNRIALTILMFLWSFLGLQAAYAENPKLNGEQLFTTYCAACHSLEPPPKAAPPVRGIIRRYRYRFGGREEVLKAIVEFASNPTEEKMVFPKAAKSHFGEMPKLPLAHADLEALVAWMWSYIAAKPNPPAGHRHGGCGQSEPIDCESESAKGGESPQTSFP